MSNLNLRALPKVSLHDHLDGGLRPQTIIDLAAEVGHVLPANDAASLARWFTESANSGSLVRYLETFVHTTAVMQTAEQLERVACEFVLDLAADGVVCGELRYAPEQHLERGLTLDEVVEAVQAGINNAIEQIEDDGGFMLAGQLVTAMRQNDRALEIAELAVRHRETGVVGFDYAGPEKGFLPIRHKAAFDFLAESFMPVTLHAGEADGIESIKDALLSGRTLRLGHGVRITEDIKRLEDDSWLLQDIAAWVNERGIALELSPSSNLQTGAIEDIENPLMTDHPFNELYRLGFKVTVNTDNRLMSGTSLTRELELLTEAFDYTIDDHEQFQINAAESAFLGLDDKEELLEEIQYRFDEVRHRG